MAHYAFLNQDNTVVEVITGKDETDSDIDWEQHYAEFRYNLTCKRTSYNTQGGVHLEGGTPFRKNFAGVGYTYDEQRDAFIPPKNYTSWTLNEETCLWEPPIPYPDDGKTYIWYEMMRRWEEYVP